MRTSPLATTCLAALMVAGPARSRPVSSTEKAWALAMEAARQTAGGELSAAAVTLGRAARYLDAAQLHLARFLLQPGDLRRLQEAVRERAAGGLSFYWLGRIQLCRGRFRDACASFQAAASLAPTSAASHLAMALACRAAGRPWRAAARAAAARTWDLMDPTLFPDPVAGVLDLVADLLRPTKARRLPLSMAALALRSGRLRQAERWARAVLRAHGQVPEAMYYLAAALQRAGWRARAKHWIERALALEPDHPGLLALRAEQLLRAGRKAEARRDLERAVDIDPADPVTLSRLASLLWDDGAYARAEKLYRYALARAPDFGPAHYGLARALERRKDYERAERHYKLAVRANPANPVYRFGYALFLRLRGRTQEARRQQRAARQLQRTLRRMDGQVARIRKSYERLRQIHEALSQGLRPPRPPVGLAAPLAFLRAHHGQGSAAGAVARLPWRRFLCPSLPLHLFVRTGRLPSGGRFQLTWTFDFVVPDHFR